MHQLINSTVKASCKEHGRTLIEVFVASCFIALCAQIQLPLPFTPIPLSAQTLAIMLVGVALGPKKAALSAIAYLMQGAIGYPVFTGGSGGLAVLFGPRGGYLLAFPFEAYLFGLLAKRRPNALIFFIGANMAAFLQLAIGSAYLSAFTGLQKTFALGIYPFMAAELFKTSAVWLFVRQKRQKEMSQTPISMNDH